MSIFIQNSPDLERILALPRRDWKKGLGGRFGTTDQLVHGLTQIYSRPGSGAILRPAQAIALAEAHDFGGLLAPIQVGGGKTLISLLLPIICKSKRALLLVPARLRIKTRDDLQEYSRDWPAITDHDGEFRIESYTTISRNPEYLNIYAPDLLIADECHMLSNTSSSGRTARIRRYLEQNSSVRFCAMSGTIGKRSILDWAHLARWALGRGTPAPLQRGALVLWAAYLDEDTKARPNPGALVRLVTDQAALLTDPVTTIRRAYGARLAATPGVIVVEGKGCSASLSVRLIRHQIQNIELLDAISKLRDFWTLPDGQPLADAHAHARHMRDLSLGFYYRWAEPAPIRWLDARREWCRFVRNITKQGTYDTEMQVAGACDRGLLLSSGVREAWIKIRDDFQPVTEAIWITSEILKAGIEHIKAGAPALAWIWQRAAAKRLARLSGWRYYGAGSEGLEAYLDASEEHVILSILACKHGKNLQRRNRAIVLSWSRSGAIMEQLIGREHRNPTEHDHVEVDCFATTQRHIEDLHASYSDACFLQDTHGTEQKLVFCDKIGWTPREKTR